MRVRLFDGNNAIPALQFLLRPRQLVWIDSQKWFYILEYLVILVGQLNAMFYDIVPPTSPSPTNTRSIHNGAPFVETKGWGASVTPSVFCNRFLERFARACEFCVPSCLGVTDELEDGVWTIRIDDEESVGGERVFSKGILLLGRWV